MAMGILAVTLSSACILISIPLIQKYLKIDESRQAIFRDCSSRQISSQICTDLYLRNLGETYAGH